MSRQSIFSYLYKGNLYINMTNRCDLHCVFCPKRKGDFLFRGMDLSLPHEPEACEVVASVLHNLANNTLPSGEVVFAGLGEPTIRLETLLEVARQIRPKLPPSIRIRAITDGLANRRYGRDVTVEMAAVIDAVSVSLNAQDGRTYQRLCPSSYGQEAHQEVLGFLACAARAGLDVTATIVAPMDGVDVEACRQIVDQIGGVAFRVRPHEPSGFQKDATIS